jgi:uncharacterized Tic20 family protein
MVKNNETTNAFLIHLSAFIGYLFPFGGIVIPLVLWKSQKEKSEFLDRHGKEAVNFNITYGLYEISMIIAICLSFWGSIVLQGSISFVFLITSFVLFQIIRIVLILLAATKAKKGEEYTYPFTINFIK